MTGQCADGANQVRLLDGTEVTIRRLDVRDVGSVLELHSRLTEHEQYLRFFVAHPIYLEEFARKVVECNDAQCALGAFENGRLLGVANYAVSSEPGAAEIAVAVAHEDHLRGVATVLLRRLATIALNNGINYFVADILLQNVAMLKVLSDAGWRRTSHFDGPVLAIRLTVTDLVDP